MLAQQEQENQAWYDRKYNEDPTKRADTSKIAHSDAGADEEQKQGF